MTSNEILRKNIRFLLWHHGVTRKEIAKLAGICHSDFCRIANGERPNITLKTLDKIAKAFGITPRLLIDEDLPTFILTP